MTALRPCLLLLPLLLSACGFHLQGSHSWPEDWRGYRLEYPSRDLAMARFVTQLDDSLRQRGLEPVADAPLLIQLHRLRDAKTVAAIGGDGKAVEFDLLRELQFQLVTPGWRSPLVELRANRRLSFDSTALLAKEAEEEQLRAALSRELIEMLVLRSETELRGLPQP